MQTLPRTITAEGKRLMLSVNNIKLTVPWNQSRYYAADKVDVVVEKKDGSLLYSIKPREKKLILTPETNWRPLKNHGVSDTPN